MTGTSMISEASETLVSLISPVTMNMLSFTQVSLATLHLASHSPPLKSVHLLAQGIHRKMTAQSCPCKFSSSSKKLYNFKEQVRDIVLHVLIRRHHFQHARLEHDAQAKEQYEPYASDFTHHSLLMTGLTHILALCVSERLSEEPSGSVPRGPTILGDHV